MQPVQANNTPEPRFQPELRYQRCFAVITETGTNSVSIQSADRIIVAVCACWFRFRWLLFIRYTFLYDSTAALKLGELLPKATDCKNQWRLGWILGFVPSNVFSSSACAWLAWASIFPYRCEWASERPRSVIKFADASFSRTGRKWWGFKRLSS